MDTVSIMLILNAVTCFITYRFGQNRGIDIASAAFIEKMALELANRGTK